MKIRLHDSKVKSKELEAAIVARHPASPVDGITVRIRSFPSGLTEARISRKLISTGQAEGEASQSPPIPS